MSAGEPCGFLAMLPARSFLARPTPRSSAIWARPIERSSLSSSIYSMLLPDCLDPVERCDALGGCPA